MILFKGYKKVTLYFSYGAVRNTLNIYVFCICCCFDIVYFREKFGESPTGTNLCPSLSRNFSVVSI